MRTILLILAVLLPRGAKRLFYNRLFGWDVRAGARIGLSYIDALHVEIGTDARIGHFNVVRKLNHFAVGRDTYIANFNQAFGVRGRPDFPSRLIVGDGVMFMSHHFVDVAGSVRIGHRATVGGRDTHIWSHTLAINADGVQELVATEAGIGDGAYLGARVTVVGCSIPDGAVVGAGAVVSKSFPPQPERVLIAGNPATIRKAYPAPGTPSRSC